MAWEDILKDAKSDARKLLLDYITRLDKWAADIILEIMGKVSEILEMKETNERDFDELDELSQEMVGPLNQEIYDNLQSAIDDSNMAVKAAQGIQEQMAEMKSLIESGDIRRGVMAFRSLAAASKNFGLNAPELNLDDIIHRLGFEGME